MVSFPPPPLPPPHLSFLFLDFLFIFFILFLLFIFDDFCLKSHITNFVHKISGDCVFVLCTVSSGGRFYVWVVRSREIELDYAKYYMHILLLLDIILYYIS
eukprot:Phypoly_transcript_27939.p1 GENE.Phypoly_transcript_27939~~Phypoly_transcript_27939.p1  ORF type:complete len:101 (+),score=4.60 Phypoly_transcript_27939:155-457(+)